MKYRYSFLLFLIAFIFQSTVMNFFSVFGTSPNLILCLVVIFSFLYEGYHGIVFGILFGMIGDVFFAEIIGVSALSYFFVALICVEMKRYFYKDSVISVSIISAIGTMTYAFICWGVNQLLDNYTGIIYVLEKQAVLVFYHLIITLIIYRIVSYKVIKHRGDRYMYRGNLQEARSLNK